MKKIRLRCESCGKSVRLLEKFASRKGRCPHCGGFLKVPPSSVFALDGVECDGCGVRLSVSQTLHILGGRIYCSRCFEEKVSSQKPDSFQQEEEPQVSSEEPFRSEVRRRASLECERRLANILIANDLLTRRQFEMASALQRRSGESLVSAILSLGSVNDDDVASVVAKETGLPFSTAVVQYVDAGVKSILPVELLRSYEVLPLSRSVDTITIAMVNPFDEEAVEEVERLTGLRVNLLICTLGSFKRTFERYFG